MWQINQEYILYRQCLRKEKNEWVSGLTRLAAANPSWLLVDVYMDIATSKTGSNLKDFNRMLEDCHAHKIEIIITMSISRFGRDSVEILDALNELRMEILLLMMLRLRMYV